MRIVIEIDPTPTAPAAVATPGSPAARPPEVSISDVSGAESAPGSNAGGAPVGGPNPDPDGAPHELLARAAALGALNAGRAPDLS